MSEEQAKYGNIQFPDVTEELLSACEGIIRITGGSQYWNGETNKALKKIEAAIARAKNQKEDKYDPKQHTGTIISGSGEKEHGHI